MPQKWTLDDWSRKRLYVNVKVMGDLPLLFLQGAVVSCTVSSELTHWPPGKSSLLFNVSCHLQDTVKIGTRTGILPSHSWNIVCDDPLMEGGCTCIPLLWDVLFWAEDSSEIYTNQFLGSGKSICIRETVNLCLRDSTRWRGATCVPCGVTGGWEVDSLASLDSRCLLCANHPIVSTPHSSIPPKSRSPFSIL